MKSLHFRQNPPKYSHNSAMVAVVATTSFDGRRDAAIQGMNIIISG